MKALVIATSAWMRTSVSLAALSLVTPWAVVTAPAARVLVADPIPAGVVTFTATEHVVVTAAEGAAGQPDRAAPAPR